MDRTRCTLSPKGTTIIQIIPFSSRIPDDLSSDTINVQGVSTVNPIIFHDIGNKTSTSLLRDVVVGLDFSFLESVFAAAIPLQSGQWPIAGSNQIVIGPAIAVNGITVGSTMLIENQSFTVMGKLKADNPLFDEFIYMDYHVAQSLFDMNGICTALSVSIDPMFSSQNDMTQIKTQIENLSPLVNALGEQNLQSAAGGFFQTIQIIQTVIAIFPLIICLLFVVVLMVLHVKDHEREFAILQALGIKPALIGIMVFGQILLTSIISFLGGLGVGFAFFGFSYNILMNSSSIYGNPFIFSQSMFEMIPTILYWEIFGITILLGSGVAVLPTIRAMRVNIISSIRKEE